MSFSSSMKGWPFSRTSRPMIQHLNPLNIRAHLEVKPFNIVLEDNGAAINILPIATMKKLGRKEEDLGYTDLIVNGFTRGVNKVVGVLPVELIVSSKTNIMPFFMIDTMTSYNALLG